MKEILSTLGVTGAALSLIAAVVFGGHDRSTFVPAPDAVAESFAREVATRRFDLAVNYLATSMRRVETPATLHRRFEEALNRAGKVNTVVAEINGMGQDTAATRAVIEGEAGQVVFETRLVRENGLWRIESLPDLVR